MLWVGVTGECLLPAGNVSASKSKLMRLNEFLFTSNLDNINMFKVPILQLQRLLMSCCNVVAAVLLL